MAVPVRVAAQLDARRVLPLVGIADLGVESGKLRQGVHSSAPPGSSGLPLTD
jgi:hypothetical protein